MVSRFKRHLSLFLVVSLATSWLILPNREERVRAQSSSTGNDPTFLPARQVLNGPLGGKLTYIDSGAGLGFIEDSSKNIISHYFTANGVSFRQDFVPLKDSAGKEVKVWGGCEYQNKVNATCKDGQLTTYDYFASIKFSEENIRSNITPLPITATYTEGQVYKYDDREASYTRYLVRIGGYVYGIFTPTIVTANAFAKVTGRTVYIRVVDNIEDPIGRYHDYINCSVYSGLGGVNPLYSTKCLNARQISNATGSSDATANKKEDIFELNQLANLWFNPKTFKGKFILKDDRKSLESKIENPIKPPIIVAQPDSGSPLPQAITFTLKYVLGTSGGTWKNNYFLFAPTDVPKELIGNVDIGPLYLAVDVFGNIAFLLEDTEKSIFSDKETNIDDNILQLGGIAQNQWFDVDRQKSPFGIGTASGITLEDYQRVITKRVYNDRNNESREITCGAVVNYPDTNKNYDELTQKIPYGDYRKCINVSTGGWLDKWGVTFNKLDKPAGSDDPCTQAFSTGFFNRFFGSIVCGMIGAIIKAAIWCAAFSVEFMTQAISLQ